MNPEGAPTLKEFVVDHVHTTLYDETVQWQPPLSGVLRCLTAAQAAWKPAPARHSIWQIVRHLIRWKRGVLEAWDGNPANGTQLAAGDWQEVSGSDADWDRDRDTLLHISSEFLTRAKALDDAGLARRIAWYKGGWTQPLAMRLVRTTTHDIYHAGQIMYLRALQGIPPR
ncbi:MAG TPA: DinB family protein [bacterium]|nr:DinB family protein [bacterium]